MEDPVTLLISMYMEAKQQGQYTKEEFTKGCQKISADTFEKWY